MRGRHAQKSRNAISLSRRLSSSSIACACAAIVPCEWIVGLMGVTSGVGLAVRRADAGGPGEGESARNGEVSRCCCCCCWAATGAGAAAGAETSALELARERKPVTERLMLLSAVPARSFSGIEIGGYASQKRHRKLPPTRTTNWQGNHSQDSSSPSSAC